METKWYLAEDQLTREEALAIVESCIWEGWTHRERAEFQLQQRRLAMPFGVFHESVEKALGRPVWTHEFGLNWEGLCMELYGLAEPPDISGIVAMIPEEKRVIVRPGGAS